MDEAKSKEERRAALKAQIAAENAAKNYQNSPSIIDTKEIEAQNKEVKQSILKTNQEKKKLPLKDRLRSMSKMETISEQEEDDRRESVKNTALKLVTEIAQKGNVQSVTVAGASLDLRRDKLATKLTQEISSKPGVKSASVGSNWKQKTEDLTVSFNERCHLNLFESLVVPISGTQ